LKTYEARGVFGCSAITVVTAQNTLGVQAAQPLPEAFIRQQAQSVLDDLGAGALKTGLLGRASVVELVVELIQAYQIAQVVVDPVILDGQGRQFVPDEVLYTYRERLFPLAMVITPNIDEAALLAQMPITNVDDMRQAAQRLHRLGAQVVVIKGGHLEHGPTIINVIYDGQTYQEYASPRLPVQNPHGVGCTFASAIAAELAKGQMPQAAIQSAHHYLQAALAGSLNWQLGAGRLPVFHAVANRLTNHAPSGQLNGQA
jgi:hydroxymethylpyrimidine kinase/phosphomethylpyrimidine kinase